MSLTRLLAGIATLPVITACASSTMVAASQPQQTPLEIEVDGKADPSKVPVIDGRVSRLRMEVASSAAIKSNLVQKLRIDKNWVSYDVARLDARLQDLPVNLPTRHIEDDAWEIQFPPNVIQLLCKGTERAQYSGILNLDSLGKSIPFTLVINPAHPTPVNQPRTRRRSAG